MHYIIGLYSKTKVTTITESRFARRRTRKELLSQDVLRSAKISGAERATASTLKAAAKQRRRSYGKSDGVDARQRAALIDGLVTLRRDGGGSCEGGARWAKRVGQGVGVGWGQGEVGWGPGDGRGRDRELVGMLGGSAGHGSHHADLGHPSGPAHLPRSLALIGWRCDVTIGARA